MSRRQLAINVTDLDKAVEFYSRLFTTTPLKVKPGYARYALGREHAHRAKILRDHHGPW